LLNGELLSGGIPHDNLVILVHIPGVFSESSHLLPWCEAARHDSA
jgi:hypothetical protein